MFSVRRCAPMLTPGPTDLASAGAGRHAVRLVAIWRHILAALTATALGISLSHAQDRGKEDKANAAPSGDQALLKKLEQMEERIRVLENELKQKDTRASEGAH